MAGQDVQEVSEGREEDARLPGGRGKADPPHGRQPADREGYGDAPVQAYIAAMPGWKTRCRAPPRRADRAPRTRRAQGGQMELAVLWHRGPGLVPQLPLLHEVRQGRVLPRTSLRPVPPGKSKQKDVRYLDIHEDDQLDEDQFAGWVKQASQLPGERILCRAAPGL